MSDPESTPQKIARILKSLLDGNAPNGAVPAELDSWAHIVQSLYDAHAQNGTESVRRAFNALAITYPELIQLVAAEEPEHPGGELAEQWQLRNLTHAYEERPPWEYVVDGLILLPSLNIVYGGPGSLKSMAMADLCLCVASGSTWLEPLPGDGKGAFSVSVKKAPVLWIDFDNGRRRTDERFAALAKSRDLPSDTPIHYVSMPMPWLDASKTGLIMNLAKLVRYHKIKLTLIDNLGLISGDTEENSSEMTQVMGNLRWLAEETETAVAVIHHQRKSNGLGTKQESLRGHSSITASLDLALLIERKEGEDDITMIPTKVRGYQPFPAIGAMFTYQHRANTYDLESARFFGVAPATTENKQNAEIVDTIFDTLGQRTMGQKDMVDEVRDTMAARPGGKAPGINKVRGLLKKLAEAEEIDEIINGRDRLYRKARKAI